MKLPFIKKNSDSDAFLIAGDISVRGL